MSNAVRLIVVSALIAALAVVLPAGGAGAGVAIETGTLTQKAGTAACISEDGTGGACADGVGLDNVQEVSVSPDGDNVYAVSVVSDALTVIDRDVATGAISQKAGTAGCVSDDGTGGACVDGVALNGSNSVAVSRDGANVYVASSLSDAVAVFDRDPATGAVTQKAGTAGCISDDGTGGACVDGVSLDNAQGVTVSPDGTNVYATFQNSDAVAVFDRNTATGVLTQKAGTAGCVSETGSAGACADGVGLDGAYDVTVSPNGATVYVGALSSDAIAVFDRDGGTGALTQKAGTAACVSLTGSGGACAVGVAMDNPNSVVVSPDGANLYASTGSSDSVVVFDRNPGTGVLTQKAGTAGCISETGTGGACADGVAMDSGQAVAVSADGTSVYGAFVLSDAVAVFDRDPGTGALTQKGSTAACVSEDGTGGACVDGVALNALRSVAVAPDSANVYGAASVSDAVTVFDRAEPPPTRVVGTVTESAAGPAPAAVGDPLPGMLVAVFGGPTGSIMRGGQTNALGGFSLEVPAESYGASFLDPTGGHVFERHNDTQDPNGFTVFGVAEGATVTVDSGLFPQTPPSPPNPATISGTVTDGAGAVPGVWVVAVDSIGNPARVSIADAGGAYSLGGLSAGDWRLIIVDPAGNHPVEWWQNGSDWPSATVISVGAGGTATADPVLD